MENVCYRACVCFPERKLNGMEKEWDRSRGKVLHSNTHTLTRSHYTRNTHHRTMTSNRHRHNFQNIGKNKTNRSKRNWSILLTIKEQTFTLAQSYVRAWTYFLTAVKTLCALKWQFAQTVWVYNVILLYIIYGITLYDVHPILRHFLVHVNNVKLPNSHAKHWRTENLYLLFHFQSIDRLSSSASSPSSTPRLYLLAHLFSLFFVFFSHSSVEYLL